MLFFSGGKFVKWGPFDQNFVEKGPLKIYLQNWVVSSGGRTTLKVKSSSQRPVSPFFFFFFKKNGSRPAEGRFLLLR